MDDRNECEKSELMLGINVFDQPGETSGAKAWGILVSNLLIMAPGTYPSDPEMGCDIGQYEFAFIDEVADEIEENLTNQLNTYLPDIPLESITIENGANSGDPGVIYIKLVFSMNEDDDNVVVAAMEKVNSIINFAVV